MDWLGASAVGRTQPESLNLDSLRDISQRMSDRAKPTRIKHLKAMISGPELGAGLRPDSEGVLRYTRLFRVSLGKFQDERD